MTRSTRSLLPILLLALFTAGSAVLPAQRGVPRRSAPPPALLAGTYELETTRGDNAQQAADAATRNLPRDRRDRAYQDLMNRLQPPVTLAIERAGRTVTISSSSGPRVTFDADGRSHSEMDGNRRSTVTRAEFDGDRLIVSSKGNRNTDFLVTFEPLGGGDGLLVTREMDSDELPRPVSIHSYYRRVSRDPRWDLYRPSSRDVRRPEPRGFLVPDGTHLTAVLDTRIYSRTSRSGERFSMTVLRPAEYRDARIDGVIARVSPFDGGHNADVRVYFDTIRLRGRTSDFEGILSAVRLPGGQSLRAEAARDADETADRAIEQGALGAALGAIIGAIAGGGKGAAIGAVIGGVGGVISAQDRDQYLDLPPGTEVTIIATGRIR